MYVSVKKSLQNRKFPETVQLLAKMGHKSKQATSQSLLNGVVSLRIYYA